MNILLVNPPIRESVPAYFHPIGLASVAAVLRQAGHEVQILDLNMLRPKREQLLDIVPDKKFDWVGVSGLITTYEYLKFLVPFLRWRYSVPIVVGGGGITSAPETYMEYVKPDLGVLGEGEYTSVDICKVLLGEMHIKDVPGLIYMDGNVPARTPPRPLEKNLDSFPTPAWDLLDMGGYANNVRHSRARRELAMLATRGCPYNCGFCYHIFGRGVRYRSVKRVVDEMQHHIDNYKTSAFLFGDECLTVNRKWIVEFCNEILRRGMEADWMCYTRADALDEETMLLMKRSGCFRVGYGVESGSQRILDAMGKRISLDVVRGAMLMASRIFGQVGITLIFGYPGENDETIRETAEFLKGVGMVTKFFHLSPYPETRVFEENKDKILARYGTLDAFFSNLSDAGRFATNLTDWTDEEYCKKKFWLIREVEESITVRRAWQQYDRAMQVEANSMDGQPKGRFYRLLGGTQ